MFHIQGSPGFRESSGPEILLNTQNMTDFLVILL